MIERLAAAAARGELGRALRFDPAADRSLPAADERARLLYLHVPFCESLCPYCSFHRVQFRPDLARAYFKALRDEVELYHELDFRFHGAYVGGGTPTILTDELTQTLDLCRERFGIREVSVETNPNHLTEERLATLERAGVNRLSVGVQSFEDDILRAVNRLERCGSGAATARGLKAAQGRFDTLNADMMFNFPAQDAAALDRDIDLLLELGVDQVTFYPLMVSHQTRRLVEGSVGKVDYGREAGLYRRIVKRLSPAYRRSTAWCFSRQQTAAIDEYVVDSDEYAGLGSGAIGYLSGTCYANTFDIGRYIADIGQGRLPVWGVRRFGTREQARYDFLMKLFSGSLDLDRMAQRHGRSFGRHTRLERLVLGAAGAVCRKGARLDLTDKGWYLWVVLMREFFTAVNNLRECCRQAAGLQE